MTAFMEFTPNQHRSYRDFVELQLSPHLCLHALWRLQGSILMSFT